MQHVKATSDVLSCDESVADSFQPLVQTDSSSQQTVGLVAARYFEPCARFAAGRSVSEVVQRI